MLRSQERSIFDAETRGAVVTFPVSRTATIEVAILDETRGAIARLIQASSSQILPI